MRTLCFVGAMFLAADLCAAQEYEQAKQAATRAQALAGQGEYEAAHDTLHEATWQCGQGAEAERCRLYLYYSLGYLEQRQSLKAPSMADMHLDRSASYYERVLQDQPDHGPTLNNLAMVYASLGAGDQAAASGPDASPTAASPFSQPLDSGTTDTQERFATSANPYHPTLTQDSVTSLGPLQVVPRSIEDVFSPTLSIFGARWPPLVLAFILVLAATFTMLIIPALAML